MNNNTAINNATVNVTINNVENKEDKDMMNNMTTKELKAMAKAAGVKGYSKMKKADLVAAIQFFTDEERKANEAVVAPVIEETENEKVEIDKSERHIALVAWAIVEASLDDDLMAKAGIAKPGQKLFFKGKKSGDVYIAKNTLVRRVAEWVIQKDNHSTNVSQEYVTKLLANIAGSGLMSAYWIFEDGFVLSKKIAEQIKALKAEGKITVKWSGRKAMVTATSIEGYLWLESLVIPGQKGYKGVAWKATSHQLNSMFKLVEEYKQLLNK